MPEDRFAILDRAKGVLILLIVWGHNHLLTGIAPGVREFLYNWHVFAFLMIALLVPFHWQRPGFVATRLVRYGVPFALFFTATWIAAIVLEGRWRTFEDECGRYLLALAIGSADLLDRASGARLFWFLPALMGLTLVRYAIARTGRWYPMLLIGTALAGFLFAGLIPPVWKTYLPLGLPIALYAFGPCLVFAAIAAWAWRRTAAVQYAALSAAIAVTLACSVLADARDTRLVLAAFRFHDVRAPVDLANHAVLAVAASLAVVLAATRLPRNRMLEWLGQASLILYLTHQMAYLALALVWRRIVGDAAPPLPVGLVLLVLTILLCCGLAAIIRRSPRLTGLVVPRDAQQFRSALRLRQRSLPAVR